MVAGQATDLGAVDQQLSLPQLEAMHNQKTGALINASVQMGALSTGRATAADLDALQQFSNAIGLAFQVQDDILDEESTTEALGKQQGADRALNKPTYTSLLGVEGAKLKLQALHNSSLTALRSFGDKAEMLRQLADFVVNRNH
jgi:farnesyl diphosphate synthase/geranylgeranyl diphosphate synthase type II